MDEFTEKQLELIENAMDRNATAKPDNAEYFFKRKVMAELRKKPETFADGQLYWDGNRYKLKNEINPPALGGMRPLSQQEVGPDYVPRAEFEKVESALEVAFRVESALEVAFRGVEDIRDSNDAYWSQGRATAVLKKIREIMEIPQ